MRSIKIVILSVILSLSFVSAAWSLVSHKEYADMGIKECNACHQSNGVSFNHDAFWDQEHRLTAEKKPNNCSDCHKLSDCMDCHFGGGIDTDLHKSTSGGDYMPKSHRTDFRELHPIKALDNPRSCYRCHEQRGFCDECHSKFAAVDLRLRSHRRQFRDIPLSSVGPNHSTFSPSDCTSCHVAGVVPKHEWSADHAREARRSLSTCQSCHPEGEVCLTCHSAKTGLRINPHPADWNRFSNRLDRASNGRTCGICHF